MDESFNTDGYLLRHPEKDSRRNIVELIANHSKIEITENGVMEKQPSMGINDKPNNIIATEGRTNVTRVIVYAYYRGGSSMLGKIISLNPSSFYLFEPFTGPFRVYRMKQFGKARGDIFVDPVQRKYS